MRLFAQQGGLRDLVPVILVHFDRAPRVLLIGADGFASLLLPRPFGRAFLSLLLMVHAKVSCRLRAVRVKRPENGGVSMKETALKIGDKFVRKTFITALTLAVSVTP